MIFYTSLCDISFHSHAITSELTDTDNYVPPYDPNYTNLMVSHYDCEKQHNLRQFTLLNVKPCTEAPSNIQHATVRPEFMFELKLNALKLLNEKLTLKRKENFVFKAQKGKKTLFSRLN